MRKYRFRLAITILAFILGTALATLWVVKRVPKGTKSEPLREIAQQKPQLVAPAGWRKIDADGQFTFYLPQEMKLDEQIGIETYHRRYSGVGVKVSVDYGDEWVQSASKSDIKPAEYQTSGIEVDGRRGTLSIYPYQEQGTIIEAHIPNVGPHDRQFTITVLFLRGEDLGLAKQIISLVRFQT